MTTRWESKCFSTLDFRLARKIFSWEGVAKYSAFESPKTSSFIIWTFYSSFSSKKVAISLARVDLPEHGTPTIIIRGILINLM